MRSFFVLVTGALLAFSSCDSAFAAEAKKEKLQLQLTSAPGTGPVLATVVDDGTAARLVVQLGKLPRGLANPTVTAAIQDGSCESPSGKPRVVMTKTVNRIVPGANREVPGELTMSVALPMRLAELRSAPHALVIATGADSAGGPFACGNIV
jgi:hypothetical protein